MKSKFLLCALGLTLSSVSVAATVQPQVATLYEQSFHAAWNKTSQAELPVYECTQIVTTATKQLGGATTAALEAGQAYKACYVDAIVNYSEAYFSLEGRASLEADNIPYGCSLYSRYLRGHVTSLAAYAERFGFSTQELNQEVMSRLQEPASLCRVALN